MSADPEPGASGRPTQTRRLRVEESRRPSSLLESPCPRRCRLPSPAGGIGHGRPCLNECARRGIPCLPSSAADQRIRLRRLHSGDALRGSQSALLLGNQPGAVRFPGAYVSRETWDARRRSPPGAALYTTACAHAPRPRHRAYWAKWLDRPLRARCCRAGVSRETQDSRPSTPSTARSSLQATGRSPCSVGGASYVTCRRQFIPRDLPRPDNRAFHVKQLPDQPARQRRRTWSDGASRDQSASSRSSRRHSPPWTPVAPEPSPPVPSGRLPCFPAPIRFADVSRAVHGGSEH